MGAVDDHAMSGTVTWLLRAWRAGDESALERVTPLIYDELKRLAARHLRGERPEHTFRPTDLVSEAYLRLLGADGPEWNDRVHFFAIAARTMRQILVDHARKICADKRGGRERPVPLEPSLAAQGRPEQVVALDDALGRLVAFDPRKARAIELHYFGGLTHEEMADVLGVHVNTIGRDLRLAEAWLHDQLREGV